MTVNAAGAWAGRVADLAGIEGVRVLPGRGIMIAMNHRLVNTVINRCQMPTDGDILVPIRTVSVIGTTDQHTDDPDDHTVDEHEVDQMFDDGEKLVPGFRAARALRVWTGVRPLFEDAKESDTETRDVTRAHALLDHEQRDGVRGFVTITGGKLTTFRLMAEETVDAVCRHLGQSRPCRTQTEPLPGSEERPDLPASASGWRARRPRSTTSRSSASASWWGAPSCRRRSPAPAPPTSTTSAASCAWGWGPARAASASTGRPASCTSSTASRRPTPTPSLLSFLQERWKGVWPILYGDQLRQARLDDWIFQGVLDVEHLPS